MVDGIVQDLDTLGCGTDAFAFVCERERPDSWVFFHKQTVYLVTGLAAQDPFLWQNGTMKDLGTRRNFGSPK
jgi:hypothetical protein